MNLIKWNQKPIILGMNLNKSNEKKKLMIIGMNLNE